MSLLVALLLVNILVLAPRWILSGGTGPPWVAMEAWLVVGLFAMLPWRRWTTALASVVAGALVLLSLLAFADTVTRLSLARPLNLYLDVHLLSAVHNLLAGNLGPVLAGLIMLGLVLAPLLVIAVLASLLRPAQVETQRLRVRWAVATVAAISLAGFIGSRVPGIAQQMTWPASQIAEDQTRHFFRMLNERERFAAELAASSGSYGELPNLLDRLRDHDVLLAFIESYGVSALYDPRYAPIIAPRLNELAERMDDAGLHLVTGTLVAPIQGGQSWLARGSLISGAWLDNQLRYDLLLASGRETLIDDFRRAGHRTVALMPQITLAWPEGERLGYDEILGRREIDYAGPSLNWVTMPDQFTWSFLQRAVRESDARPLFAEISLISSHAPWTPILPVLDDWEGIGDGSIFARWADAGERPEILWRDYDRVREHYALSVGYAIDAAIGYAERYVDEHTLCIVLGDHQPAPLITGDDASRKVPVHVISRDPALLQPFREWGFEAGALPDPDQPAHRMDTFRDWFVKAFSEPREVPETKAAAEEG